MFDTDPLRTWLEMSEYSKGAAHQRHVEMIVAQRLQTFQSARNKRNVEDLDLHDVMTVQNQFREVLEAGGPGNQILQEELLDLVARAANRRSLPFWLDLIDYRRPRESFHKRRRIIICSAIAYLAIHEDAAEAYDAIVALTRHTLPEIRELAVEYLGKAYRVTKRPLPPAIVARLNEITAEDTAFAPRFLARRWLREIGEQVPLDKQEDVFVFKVRYKWSKDFHCLIAVQSNQTLKDLHIMIQEAYEWDDDHLYAFYMTGDTDDQRYMIAGPHLSDVPTEVHNILVGEIGLMHKDMFVYFFDFGDHHEFEVEVVDIQPQADAGPYPKILDRQGTPPPQYSSGEDWDDE